MCFVFVAGTTQEEYDRWRAEAEFIDVDIQPDPWQQGWPQDGGKC